MDFVKSVGFTPGEGGAPESPTMVTFTYEKAVAVKPDNQKAQTFLKQFKADAEAGR